MTRFEDLRSPLGNPIVGTDEIVPAIGLVQSDGDGGIQWAGDTDLCWDAQDTRTRNGERVWVDSEGYTFTESEINWQGINPRSL